MKRVRPPMPPLAVRVQVAERQFFADKNIPEWANHNYNEMIECRRSLTLRLKFLLAFLFGRQAVRVEFALDHDPALVLRPYNPRIKDVAARYTPHAHDPGALVYREKADHQQKTTGRRPGAERTVTTKGSDIGLKSKFNRLEGRLKPKRKSIKSRGFAKGPKRARNSTLCKTVRRPWPKRRIR